MLGELRDPGKLEAEGEFLSPYCPGIGFVVPFDPAIQVKSVWAYL